jgi:hypothetical protein
LKDADTAKPARFLKQTLGRANTKKGLIAGKEGGLSSALRWSEALFISFLAEVPGSLQTPISTPRSWLPLPGTPYLGRARPRTSVQLSVTQIARHVVGAVRLDPNIVAFVERFVSGSGPE